MDATKEINILKRELRELKREMKAQGVRRTSCFNGGLSAPEAYYNGRIFALTTQINNLLKSAL